MSHGHDDFGEDEPVRGLPERLPEGERILWQGAPDWRSLAFSAFHVGGVIAYFALLMTARAVIKIQETGNVLFSVMSGLSLLPLLVASAGVLAFLAWLTSRATVYTITNCRVVMRVGIALPKAINIPFRVIASAALSERSGGRGDIPLKLKGTQRMGYVILWPHVRPWRLQEPEPMLRSVPDARAVAALLADALVKWTAEFVTEDSRALNTGMMMQEGAASQVAEQMPANAVMAA